MAYPSNMSPGGSQRSGFYWLVATAIWFVGLFSSSFYVFASGQPQPAHIVLLAAMLMSMYRYAMPFYLTKVEKKTCIYLILFLFWVIFINIVWALLTNSWSFVFRASLFMLYSSLIFFSGVYALKHVAVRRAFSWAASLGLVVILMVWAAGGGRYDFGSRYNAFFNDPNQMAFWVICASCVILLLNEKQKIWMSVFVCTSSLTLVLASQSRSALMAQVILMMGAFLSFGSSDNGDKKFSTSNFVMASALGVMVLVVLFSFIPKDIYSDAANRFLSSDFTRQADTRGYFRILEYPQYLIFGAGQGLDERFGSIYEIHSTWAGILFYYGIVGALLFAFYAGNIFFNLTGSQKVIFMAPFVYGLSTYGARTPIFWVFLASALWAACFAKRSDN